MSRSSEIRKGRTNVASFCWSKSKPGESIDSVFPSVRMAYLFYEFLDRYKDWKLAKLQATVGTIISLCLGLFSVIIPLYLPKTGVPISLGILLLLYFAVRYYLQVSERVSHLYINVHILHHHLSGKLEVGFCDHHEPCRCVEDFRDYVFENYRISFDNGYLQ